MKQLLLDLAMPAANLDFVVAGPRLDLYTLLQDILHHHQPTESLYLHGNTGSGKTHWLRTACASAAENGWRAAYCDCRNQWPDFDTLETANWLALDNVECLSEEAQFTVFALFNQIKQQEGCFIASGNLPAMQLPVRADLATRFAWGLCFEIPSLSDRDKLRVLQLHAARQGAHLSQEVGQYLLNHWARDLPSLIQALEAIDRSALSTHRPITLPLARQVLSNSV